SQYLKVPAKLTYASLYLNRPQDQWWRKRYRDVGLPLPRTANMHYDSDCGMVKAMVYLNDDVTPTSGPFCYIVGTHRSHCSLIHRISGQATPYAEISLETPQSRQFMLRLPPLVRNISHYGDDLLPGSDMEYAYFSKERQFLSRECNLILFD